MAETPDRKLGLKDLSKVSRNDLQAALEGLVEANPTLAEKVNARLDTIRETTGERAKAISETARQRQLSPEQQEELFGTLKTRFEANMQRHPGIVWTKVQAKLEARPEKMWSLSEMERTGGEPDVVGYDKKTGQYIFFDCSSESPEGRRKVAYDREGQRDAEKRGHKPAGNADDMSEAMGISILTEAEYRELQQLGNFDKKTWSWLKTPSNIRNAGAALSGNRFNDNFLIRSHGAGGYGGDMAFRGSLRV